MQTTRVLRFACRSMATNASGTGAGTGAGAGAGAVSIADAGTRLVASAGKPGDPRMGALVSGSGDGDVVVVGFPFDEGCTRNGGRAGAKFGPAAFRKFVPKLGCAKNPEWDTDLTGLSIGDAGDAAGASLEEAHADLKKRVMGILSAGGIPFVVGGGNDQSYPNADALMSTCGSDVVSVINVDAHLDVRTTLEGGVVHSGSPFRLLLDDERFKGQFTEFACQGMQCSVQHSNFVKSKSGRLVWLADVLGQRAGDTGAVGKTEFECAQQAFARTLDESPGRIFLSFDIDSIRGSDCPGVSCPATAGLTADMALRFCFLAGKHPRVAMVDVSEMNPVVEDYRTPRLVTFMFYHFLMGVAARRQASVSERA